MSRKRWSFTLIMLIIGVMAAVQYKSLQNPTVTDTRDEWQLKESLQAEQQVQIELLKEIRKYEGQLEGYEAKRAGSKEDALQKTLEELREKAGLVDVTGSGVTFQLAPLFDNIGEGEEVPTLSPQLLQRLVNELNTYGATAVQIDDQRIVATTPIRDVNGKVTVNQVALPPLPLEVKVIAKDAEELYDRMKVSNAFDHFAIDNIELTMSKPEDGITIGRYKGEIDTEHMEAIKAEEEGK